MTARGYYLFTKLPTNFNIFLNIYHTTYIHFEKQNCHHPFKFMIFLHTDDKSFVITWFDLFRNFQRVKNQYILKRYGKSATGNSETI